MWGKGVFYCFKVFLITLTLEAHISRLEKKLTQGFVSPCHIYDTGLIMRLTSIWNEELRSTSSSTEKCYEKDIVSSLHARSTSISTDEHYKKYIVSIPHTCDCVVSHVWYGPT
jgi:hypothetical protein